jgi:hypothetical protein
MAVGKLNSANDYLPELRRYLVSGKITLQLDFRYLSRTHSPVSTDAEQARLILAALVGIPVAWWVWNVWLALALGIAIGALYYFVERPRVQRKILKLVMDKALVEYSRWTALWQYGGITLSYVDVRAGKRETCVAPSGNWVGFLNRLVDIDTNTQCP